MAGPTLVPQNEPEGGTIHWSVTGFTVLCGADVQHLRQLTRYDDVLTCEDCKAARAEQLSLDFEPGASPVVPIQRKFPDRPDRPDDEAEQASEEVVNPDSIGAGFPEEELPPVEVNPDV
jgi:hypothetical protein